MQTRISIVVFDIGNVLIEWNPEHLYKSLIPDDLERKAFLTSVCSMDWNLQQDLGRSWEDAIRVLVQQFPEKADLIDAYSARWHEMVPGTIDQSVKILSELKTAGVPLYAITNFSSEKFRETQARFQFLTTSFLDIVVSAEERLIKPDSRIYQVLFDRNNLDARDCLFIDDSKANIEAAAKIGMSVHHFTEATVLRKDLVALGLLKR